MTDSIIPAALTVARAFEIAFVPSAAAAATFSAFSPRRTRFAVVGLRGHLVGLLDVLQFIGITSLVAFPLPTLYMRFAILSSWTNFIFNFFVSSSSSTCTSAGSSCIVGLEKNSIFFVNVAMVGATLFLTLLFSVLATMIKTRSLIFFKRKGSENEFGNCVSALLRVYLLSYTGLTVTSAIQLSQFYYGFNFASPSSHSYGTDIAATMIAAVVMLVNISFIIFAVVFLGKKQRQAGSQLGLRDLNFKAKYGALYNDLKDKFALFGCVVLFKKFIIGVLMGFLQSSTQIIAIILLLLVYLSFLIAVRPYASRIKNGQDIVFTVVQAIVMLLLYVSLGASHSDIQMASSIVAMILVCAMVVVYLGSVIFEAVNNIRKSHSYLSASASDELAMMEVMQGDDLHKQVHTLLEEDDPDYLDDNHSNNVQDQVPPPSWRAPQGHRVSVEFAIEDESSMHADGEGAGAGARGALEFIIDDDDDDLGLGTMRK
eukprot:GEZU01013694.1.p1 GENE.GEZU01013694.1~~GEZU01013694.1.p1  ORF type:complete len:485 (-),score=76.94 GEZU01013694.1:158-1612(-)